MTLNTPGSTTQLKSRPSSFSSLATSTENLTTSEPPALMKTLRRHRREVSLCQHRQAGSCMRAHRWKPTSFCTGVVTELTTSLT